MLNILSIVIGLVTLALGLVAFFPLLGWMNWLVIPIGIVGAAVGAMAVLGASLAGGFLSYKGGACG